MMGGGFALDLLGLAHASRALPGGFAADYRAPINAHPTDRS